MFLIRMPHTTLNSMVTMTGCPSPITLSWFNRETDSGVYGTLGPERGNLDDVKLMRRRLGHEILVTIVTWGRVNARWVHCCLGPFSTRRRHKMRRSSGRKQMMRRAMAELRILDRSTKTSLERITEVLERQQQGVCDDCLSIAADVTPRQQVNQICRGLSDRGVISRSRKVCPVCNVLKLVNHPPLTHAVVEKASRPAGISAELGAPKTADTAARLDQLRREMVAMLISVESESSKGIGFSARITRARESGKLPSSVACMMQTLNSLRNLVVYEQFLPGPHETAVIDEAWNTIADWRKKSLQQTSRSWASLTRRVRVSVAATSSHQYLMFTGKRFLSSAASLNQVFAATRFFGGIGQAVRRPL